MCQGRCRRRTHLRIPEQDNRRGGTAGSVPLDVLQLEVDAMGDGGGREGGVCGLLVGNGPVRRAGEALAEEHDGGVEQAVASALGCTVVRRGDSLVCAV